MFPHGILIVAEKIGNIGHGDAALQQNARESRVKELGLATRQRISYGR
jgi:hypothetical protein